MATINTLTGYLSPISSGTTMIKYRVNNSCPGSPFVDIKPFAVLPAYPDAGIITPITPLCAGTAPVAFSETVPGGIWSSSNTAIADVNPASGMVHPIAAGIATISYTVTGPCGTTSTATVTVTVTATPNPGTIFGPSSICTSTGSVPYTSSGDPGGTWSASGSSISVNSLTGVVTPTGLGASTLIYTVTSGTCSASTSLVVTVDPIPTLGSISGPTNVCSSTTPVIIYTISAASPLGTFSCTNPTLATISPGGTATFSGYGTK